MNPTAILMGDTHITNKQPRARIDCYWETIQRKIKFICKLQEKYKCPILHSGDLLHKAKSSPGIEEWCIYNLPKEIVTIPGNHDLPNHNIKYFNDSSLGVLNASAAISVLESPDLSFHFHHQNKSDNDLIEVRGFPWNTDLTKKYKKEDESRVMRKVAIIHELVYEDKHLWPGIVGYKARVILRKLKEFDLIVAGHNHQAFTYEYHGRLLVNTGSLSRYKADQVDYRPRVYLWYVESNTVEEVFIPIEDNVISNAHIISKKEKDKRRTAYIDMLKQTHPSSNKKKREGFVEKIEDYLRSNKVRKGVEEFIWECIGEN